MESARDLPFERVLLVGFMASGKTSVGRELADLLEWSFRDFDDEIEAEVGRPIPEIFRDKGEAHFRTVEARVGERLLSESQVVLATGGGWAAAPGRLDSVPDRTLSVWLRISPEEAVRRARGEGPERPLLETEHPVERARTLLAEREPSYRRADIELDSESAPPRTMARTIVEFMRVSGDRSDTSHAKSG